MKVTEIRTRLDFIKNLYMMYIMPELDQRHLEDAKKDIKAMEFMDHILDERIKQYGGSEEIYTK